MCAGTSFWLSILMRRWTWPWIIVACSSFASRWKAGWWARPKSSLNTIQKNTSPGILQPIRLNQRLHHCWLLCFSCKIGFTKLKYERSSKFKHSWELWWPSWKRSEVEISAANVAGAGRQLIWPRMKLLWLFKKVRIRLLKKKAKFSSLPIVSSNKVTFCLSCVVDWRLSRLFCPQRIRLRTEQAEAFPMQHHSRGSGQYHPVLLAEVEGQILIPAAAILPSW